MGSALARRSTNRGSSTLAADGGRLDHALSFLRLLWAVDHGMRTLSKAMRTRHGVTGPERLLLRMVGCHPSSSAGSVARLLHLHPSSITGTLERLVRRGLLERGADPDDRRRAVLRLTHRGRLLVRLRSGTVEAAVLEVLQDLSREEILLIQSVLRSLARGLERQTSAAARPRR